jgi:hypothetical protein
VPKNTSLSTSLFLLAALLGAPIANAGLIIGNMAWLQPKDLVNYSWNDFNAVCPSGSCNGQLSGNGPNISGWQWATASQVGDFFATFSDHPGGIANFHDNSLIPGSDFLRLGFNITTDPQLAGEFGISAVLGLTSTLTTAGQPSLAGVGISFGFPVGPPFGSDFFVDLTGPQVDQPEESVGAWLYRSATVPVPATFGLLLVGLMSLAGSRGCCTYQGSHKEARKTGVTRQA